MDLTAKSVEFDDGQVIPIEGALTYANEHTASWPQRVHWVEGGCSWAKGWRCSITRNMVRIGAGVYGQNTVAVMQTFTADQRVNHEHQTA